MFVVLYSMKLLVFLALSLFLFACGHQYRFANRQLAAADTSFVYSLPYPKGKSHLLVQGYNSRFSHRGRLGLDFKMKTGSPITAARGGVVVGLEESNTEGGPRRSYFRKANFVTIRHEDGTMASYGHLKHNGVAVNLGDTVQAGQVIAHSGSTGYSAIPHLHFSVWKPDTVRRKAIPTRFHTRNGIRYLRPGYWYRSTRVTK